MTTEAGAGDAGAAAAAAAAATAAAAAAAAGAGAKPAWHGIAETDTAGVQYVTNKGWQSPADVIKSYQGAEKLIGRDPTTLLTLPRADDPAGFLGVMDKLGRPADPAKYEFDQPKDLQLDQGYMDWAKGAFHKVGLTGAQAKTFTTEHNAYVRGVLAKQENDYNISVDADKKALLDEWKGGHERLMSSAQNTAKALGFTEPMIEAMERTVGYKDTMKFFAELGKKMSEDGFVSQQTRQNSFTGMLTPAEASSQWDAMKMDPNQMAALRDTKHPGHAVAQKKQTDLFKAMHPSG